MMGDGVFEPAHLEPQRAGRRRGGARARSARGLRGELGRLGGQEALHPAGMKTYVAAGAESRLSAVIERRGRGQAWGAWCGLDGGPGRVGTTRGAARQAPTRKHRGGESVTHLSPCRPKRCTRGK